jgi:hypothetical protein
MSHQVTLHYDKNVCGSLASGSCFSQRASTSQFLLPTSPPKSRRFFWSEYRPRVARLAEHERESMERDLPWPRTRLIRPRVVFPRMVLRAARVYRSGLLPPRSGRRRSGDLRGVGAQPQNRAARDPGSTLACAGCLRRVGIRLLARPHSWKVIVRRRSNWRRRRTRRPLRSLIPA